MKLATIRLAAVSLGFLALACKPAPEKPAVPLSSVTVPAGFTFNTSHGVDIKLSAAASALPASGRGELDILRADGKTLYRGQINATQPVHVKLSVPLKDANLLATIEGPNGAKSTVTLPIANEAASYSFQ